MERTKILTLLWIFIQLCMLAFVISAWAAAGSLYDPPDMKWDFNGLTKGDEGFAPRIDTSNGGTGCVDPTCRCTVNHSAAFSLVWLSLLAVGLSVFGTIVMKRNRTPMMIGAFVGIVVMMGNWTFVMAVQEGGNASDKSDDFIKLCGGSPGADKAVIAFAVFLFLSYTTFGTLLGLWRNDILGMDDSNDYPGSGGGGSAPYADEGPVSNV